MTLAEALAALDAAATRLEAVAISKTQYPDPLTIGDGSIYKARRAVEAAGRAVAVAAFEEAAQGCARLAWIKGVEPPMLARDCEHSIRYLAAKVSP